MGMSSEAGPEEEDETLVSVHISISWEKKFGKNQGCQFNVCLVLFKKNYLLKNYLKKL